MSVEAVKRYRMPAGARRWRQHGRLRAGLSSGKGAEGLLPLVVKRQDAGRGRSGGAAPRSRAHPHPLAGGRFYRARRQPLRPARGDGANETASATFSASLAIQCCCARSSFFTEAAALGLLEGEGETSVVTASSVPPSKAGMPSAASSRASRRGPSSLSDLST